MPVKHSPLSFEIANGSGKLDQLLYASATYDPANIATNNANTSTTVTVTGAAIGDLVLVGHTVAIPAGLLLTGDVTSSNTVTVKLFNNTGGAIDIASGTIKVLVIKASLNTEFI